MTVTVHEPCATHPCGRIQFGFLRRTTHFDKLTSDIFSGIALSRTRPMPMAGELVELGGIEPPTSCVPRRRSPS